jgi:hypothetical protein
MERRNDPTPLNYQPIANNGAAYGTFTMRGIQIKQAFRLDEKENELHLRFTSEGHTEISLSFAARDDAGAAQHLLIEYLDSSGTWLQAHQSTSQHVLTNSYQRYLVEMAHISQLNNNPLCSLRIRFGGNNMTAENGQRVTLNNIAIDGKPISVACEPVIPIVCNDTILICPGEKVNSYLFGGSPGAISWQVSPQQGVSKASGSTTSTGDLVFTRRGTYTITFAATNSNTPINCFPESVSMCQRIVIVSGDSTTIDAIPPICGLETTSPLPTTSTSGITGSWSPAFSNLASAVYTFTPDSGYCLTAVDVPVVIIPPTIPAFDTIAKICIGDTLNALPTTSLNGVAGAWSPELNNQQTTTYIFSPTGGQCAVPTQLTIEVEDCPPVQNKTSQFTLVQVLPNPLTSYLQVSSTYAPIESLVITDLLGKVVHRSELNDKTPKTYTLLLNTLPQGLYLLQIKTDNKTQVIRLIKKAEL